MLLICFLLLLCFASGIKPHPQGLIMVELNVCPSNENEKRKVKNENDAIEYWSEIISLDHQCICNEKYYGGSCDQCKYLCSTNEEASEVNNECTCKCKKGFGGVDCRYGLKCKADTLKETGIICNPQGTKSVEENDECKCICKEGWFGKFCNNHKELLCKDQCSKEGTSKIDFIDDQCICHCKPGYFGRKAKNPPHQYEFEDCSYHCEKGSYCDDDGTKTAEWEGGVCFCRCQKDYYGPKCSKKCVGWENSGCNAEGTDSMYIEGDKCKCKCKQGYYGEKCANQCNNYNGDGLSNCLAEGTESAEINDDECKCNCKKGFYGKYCNKCSVYCGKNSIEAEDKDGTCTCTCRNTYYGKTCEFNCDSECGVGEGRAKAANWENGKCVCNCVDEGLVKYFTPMCSKKCNKYGAKDVESKCKWGGHCKDRFAGKKCQIDKYTGKSEQNETGHNNNETTQSTGDIMGITVVVSGILIIIIGAWI